MVDLTICTNIIPLDKKNIELNWDLTTRLNTSDGWRWIVTVDNNETEGRAVEKVTQLGDKRCELVEVYDEEIKQASVWGANYHHGAALNKILNRIKSRYVLFIDPDFYIIRQQWMEEILSYMQENQLAFFGVPWHPKWYMKYRYFPCIHCLFIDLKKIPLHSLNLLPDVPDQITKKPSSWKETKSRVRPYLPTFARDSFQFFKWAVLNRRTICKEWDTGSRIYLRYRGFPEHRFEYVTPVFRPQEEFIGPNGVFFAFNRVIEKILPDQYCYIPKRKESFTSKGFKDAQYPDVSQWAWEEFMWKEKPFGFHVRRYPKRNENLVEHDNLLPSVLEQCAQNL